MISCRIRGNPGKAESMYAALLKKAAEGHRVAVICTWRGKNYSYIIPGQPSLDLRYKNGDKYDT